MRAYVQLSLASLVLRGSYIAVSQHGNCTEGWLNENKIGMIVIVVVVVLLAAAALVVVEVVGCSSSCVLLS